MNFTTMTFYIIFLRLELNQKKKIIKINVHIQFKRESSSSLELREFNIEVKNIN